MRSRWIPDQVRNDNLARLSTDSITGLMRIWSNKVVNCRHFFQAIFGLDLLSGVEIMKQILIGMILATPVLIQALPEKLPIVKVAEVKSEELFDLYVYPVSLQSKQESEVYSEIIGVIKDVKVKIGQKVKVGDPLVLLQHTQPGYSEAAFRIKSPIAGTVADIFKKTGARVQKGEKLIHVVNRHDISIKFEIPEAELSLLKRGLSGLTEFRLIKEKLPVKITGVSPLVNPMSGTAKGELDWSQDKISDALKNEIKTKLFPGMIGRAQFKLNFRKGISIPKESVTFEKQQHFVRTVLNNKVAKKRVTLGKEIQGRVEITNGLSLGEVIIVSRSKYLKENEKVKIEKSETTDE